MLGVRDLHDNSHDAILARWPELFEDSGAKCRKRVWWCHKGVDAESTQRAGAVGALPVVTSQYQAAQLVGLGWDAQFAVIPLGCRIRQCLEPRNHAVAVWTSAYDRGLDTLISIWRSIRRELPPGAKLKIAGGPAVYREYGGYLVEIERRLREETCAEPDICWLGPLNSLEIARVLSEGGVFPYSCNVAESFCLSVLEAQAAGCIPIVTPYGALSERVIDGETGWIESEHQFGERILEYLRAADGAVIEQMRRASVQVAEALSWARVAQQWEQQVLARA